MQEKNVVMNTYWSDNERFADIVNVALFQAKKLILADQLEEIDGCESTMVGEKNRQKKGVQKYRDVADGCKITFWCFATPRKRKRDAGL